MATEVSVYEVMKQLGYTPIEDKCIVVKYAPANLSAKLMDFFSIEYYVLQLCENELVLAPFKMISWDIKKEVTLSLPKAAIKSVTVTEDAMNYRIDIQTETDTVSLSAQQKEASFLRSSGTLASEYTLMGSIKSNWHAENLDGVLADLKQLDKA